MLNICEINVEVEKLLNYQEGREETLDRPHS